ncbi:MAG: glycosyltransferase, partial [Gemmatimonadetes bacterium]|nr:glycosyltransferase [Gemmatimonadota bacterium]NIR81589.1 glycosyltransferase [Gemmatimonadota bacterium]NIT90430.1 glycosyltransferase [Gemmatimonadota bacterium]NIU34263.1 glycosyltransferase [Gemmatimonadota bacterium]NIU38388.1 glycosyltransferase [Gemmatimonadota bacterium]
MSPSPPNLGVVVPTLNEADRLPLLLADLARLPVAHTTVVADGGSTDGTRDLALRRGARVVEAPRGRGVQLNAGARAVGEAPWLLFLHADVRLSAEAGEALAAWLRRGDRERAAFFRFGLEGDDWFWRFLEFGQRLRERIYGLVYGDQGLVVSRELFHDVGGYPEIPLMEDVEILRRLRRRVRVERLPATLRASPRRYEREGRCYGWLRNAALVSLYLAGVGPERLAAWYGPMAHGSGEAPSGRAGPAADGGGGPGASRKASRILLVFAKAPVPGRVKTRLASALGPAAAA